ncbi:Uu.00g079030.m01.CDS01 [Anthostomella pinea]|uniref:Uu.00g079030.m01.CDS01 n=1 Tax=Anthostomella pinea TaxID=933095 RepID=A0AAI8VLE2_9PEZI|nr:Uu.00g079030.m01.CDS01 [Anthostomella pinea]
MENSELLQTWKEVELRVAAMTNMGDTEVRRCLTVDDVLSSLDETRRTNSKAAEKYSTVRSVFSKTLMCIETIGGFVASGVSTVFPPASTCFKALIFVIQAWRDCEGIFNTLGELLEKCTYFLDRLSCYRGAMDQKLTRVACLNLRLFVKILEQTLEMKKKRHWDDGVSDLLTEMKTLSERELGYVAALTFKSSNEAASHSRDILAVALKQEPKIDSLAVEKILELEPAVISDNPWEKTWQRHKVQLIEGSGDWLDDHALFASWVKGSDQVKPILGLQGKTGAEASKALPPGPRWRTTFLSLTPKVSPDKRDAVDVLSKSLLWQLWEADEPFLKSMADVGEKSGVFENHVDMWTQLLFENDDRSSIDITFFLVIDGLGKNVKDLTKLLHMETFKLVDQVEGIQYDKITLGETNKKDIELYINQRMNHIETLMDEKNAHVRQEIIKALTESTDGDYYEIGSALDKISKTDDPATINEYLKDAGKQRPELIDAQIENLNQTLDAKGTGEINEMILWVDYSYEWQNLGEMEAMLVLRTDKASSAGLLSLESKIRLKKYSLFSVDNQGLIDYTVTEIREQIPDRKAALDDTYNGGVKEILPAEVNLVKHYLSTVCPADVYEKFGFDEFFDRKMIRRANSIWRDRDNAHITIALRCMACIEEPRTEKTEKLQRYAVDQLCYHLRDTVLPLADRTLKRKASAMLARLFTDEYAVESLFRLSSATEDAELDSLDYGTDMIPESFHCWVMSNQGAQIVGTWFKDAAVIQGIEDTPFVASLNSAGEDRHKVLFDLASRKAATCLFRVEAGRHEMLRAFIFLAGFLTKAGEFRFQGPRGYSYPNSRFVSQVEDWSRKALDIVDVDSLWEAQVAALLLYLEGETITKKDSEARARTAMALDSRNWRAAYILAQVVQSNEESVSLLSSTIEDLMKNNEWRTVHKNSRHLAKMILDLGDKHWASDDGSKLASDAYLRSLEMGHSSPALLRKYFAILEQYGGRRDWEAIVLFLEKMLQMSQPVDIAGNFGCLNITDNDAGFNTLFVSLVKNTERWDFLNVVYEKAFIAARTFYQRCLVRLSHGFASNRSGYQDSAIKIWESVLSEVPEKVEVFCRPWVFEIVSNRLVASYMEKAFKMGLDSETVQTYYGKIESLHAQLEALTTDSHLRGIRPPLPYARYFHLRGDEARAKEILKTSSAQNLEMLSDDSLENDYEAYWDLGTIFSTLDDIPNALVAWEMMARSRQAEYAEYVRKKQLWDGRVKLRSKQGRDGSTMVEGVQDSGSHQDTEAPDGQKAESGPASQEPSEDLVEPELAIAGVTPAAMTSWSRDGTLDVRVCDKSHDMYYIPKREEKQHDAAAESQVVVNGEEMDLEAWKVRIKAKYVDFGDDSTL